MEILYAALLFGVGVPYLVHSWKLDRADRLADRLAEREAARAEAMKRHPAGAGR